MIKLPVELTYNGKGAKSAKTDLASLAKSYAASAASAAGLVSLIKSSTKAYLDDARAQAQLAQSLRNNTLATQQQVAGVEQYISKTQAAALVSDDQLRPALSRLLAVTKSTTQAQDLLQVAIDAAAFTGKSLEQTTAAITRAYQGQYRALRGLGVAVSDANIKAKNFDGAMAQVEQQVKGANDAINKGAVGALKKLGIIGQEAAERLGQGFVDFGTDVVNATQKVKQGGTTFLDELGATGKGIRWVFDSLKKDLKGFNDLYLKVFPYVKHTNDEVTQSFKEQASVLGRYMEQLNGAYYAQQKDADAKKKAATAAADAAAKAKDLAKANRETLASALEAAKSKLEAVRAEMDAYAGSIRDTISGFASLSDAYSTATANEDAYQAALKDRADAYAELADLNKTVFDVATGKTTVANAEDLAAAYDKVAKAESAVTAAQGKRRDYTAEFSAQVAAAKQFSTDLQALAAAGLQAPGIQQLLNMGPVAGDAVAKDLLAGTKGITIGSLNADLAGLAESGQTLGGQIAGGVYGADLTAAQGAVGAVGMAQTVNVTIQATSADPDKIVAAIVAWSKKNGKLPSTIKVAG